MNTIQQINASLGNMDLYLLDYLLKGKFEESKKVLDAGCGEGRNLTFFEKAGLDVYGADREPLAIKMCRIRYSSVPSDHFSCTNVYDLPWPDGFFDLVISSAVLHFAPSEEKFFDMWKEHSRVTAKGGFIFLRMASLWGGVEPSDFSFYLTDEVLEKMLGEGWEKAEPAKSVLVEKSRSMAALLLKRR